MLYIMRHGQTDANLGGQIQGQNDVPLNDTGRTQATMALGKIVPLGIKRIVSRAGRTQISVNFIIKTDIISHGEGKSP